MEAVYRFFDLIRKMWEWWDEHGKNRERIGELIIRGMRSSSNIRFKPIAQQVKEPRKIRSGSGPRKISRNSLHK